MRIISILLLLFILVNTSCKKDDANGVVKGNKNIIVTVWHHERILSGIKLYLKYNATEFPGNDSTLYDWSATSDLSGVAQFNDLFNGNYFLYGKGIDTGIGLEVIGGAVVNLNDSTTVNNEIYVRLMVTE
jgi:hypothetical protein